MNPKVPNNFQALFPSTDINNLDPKRDRKFIIQELLKNATLEAWKWMKTTYSNDEIIEVIKNSRSLNEKDVTLWVKYLHIPTDQIRCLQTKYQKIQKAYWLQ
ncbi:MAG: hypothetical protein AAB546_01525 [Patescibacteria group bacterium]